jgi:hypothetical protein
VQGFPQDRKHRVEQRFELASVVRLRQPDRFGFGDRRGVERREELGDLLGDALPTWPCEPVGRERLPAQAAVPAGPERSIRRAGRDLPARVGERHGEPRAQEGEQRPLARMAVGRPRVPGDPEDDPVARLDRDAAEPDRQQPQRRHRQLGTPSRQRALDRPELEIPAHEQQLVIHSPYPLPTRPGVRPLTCGFRTRVTGPRTAPIGGMPRFAGRLTMGASHQV